MRIGCERDENYDSFRESEIDEVRRIPLLSEKLEIHHTPEHDSWPNMAEIESWVLSRQCLQRRVPGFRKHKAEATAWQGRRAAA